MARTGSGTLWQSACECLPIATRASDSLGVTCCWLRRPGGWTDANEYLGAARQCVGSECCGRAAVAALTALISPTYPHSQLRRRDVTGTPHTRQPSRLSDRREGRVCLTRKSSVRGPSRLRGPDRVPQSPMPRPRGCALYCQVLMLRANSSSQAEKVVSVGQT
jgi:hypothetical protein